MDVWSTRRDKNGLYMHLGGKPQVSGPDGGALGWIQQVDVPGCKGFLAAAHNGINYYPIASFEPNSKAARVGVQLRRSARGGRTAGGHQGRRRAAGLHGAAGRIRQRAEAGGRLPAGAFSTPASRSWAWPCSRARTARTALPWARSSASTSSLAGPADAAFKEIGSHKLSTPAAGFAGPGGKDKNSVYVVDVAGNVTVLTIK